MALFFGDNSLSIGNTPLVKISRMTQSVTNSGRSVMMPVVMRVRSNARSVDPSVAYFDRLRRRVVGFAGFEEGQGTAVEAMHWH